MDPGEERHLDELRGRQDQRVAAVLVGLEQASEQHDRAECDHALHDVDRQISEDVAPEHAACRWMESERCRSEEHTSELQSLMRNSYAVFCLKKKKKHRHTRTTTQHRDTYNTTRHRM